MSLDDLGLIPTLETFVKEFMEKKKLNIHFTVFDNFNLVNSIPSMTKLIVYRVIQESLNNASKHANAQNITVRLEILREFIKIFISDNGKGFEIEEVFKTFKTNGKFGLLGMKERIELADGNIEIITGINKGTTIKIQLPWNTTK